MPAAKVFQALQEARLSNGLTLGEMRDQVRQLNSVKGFDISLEQRLAYLTSEVGEVASEVLKLSRDGNSDVGKMDESEVRAIREDLGMEIYDVIWNLLGLADKADVDLESVFEKKSRLNKSREW